MKEYKTEENNGKTPKESRIQDKNGSLEIYEHQIAKFHPKMKTACHFMIEETKSKSEVLSYSREGVENMRG